jgi:hypothetical protein
MIKNCLIESGPPCIIYNYNNIYLYIQIYIYNEDNGKGVESGEKCVVACPVLHLRTE